MLVYLPMALGDARVLMNKGGDIWLVDNCVLETSSPGLGYRRSKKSDDRVGEDSFAAWGTFVKGIDTGDGWLLTETQDATGHHTTAEHPTNAQTNAPTDAPAGWMVKSSKGQRYDTKMVKQAVPAVESCRKPSSLKRCSLPFQYLRLTFSQ